MDRWTQAEAIELCKKIEAICPDFGCHVALTGGLLYKEGERKDCDLLLYRIRQWDEVDFEGLWKALYDEIGLVIKSGFGWCYKAEYKGKKIDIFNPDDSTANGDSHSNHKTAEGFPLGDVLPIDQP